MFISVKTNQTIPLLTADNIWKDIHPMFFQPEVNEDFPTTSGDEPRIPHIIHQTYKSESIPQVYIPLIKSFIQHNKNWTYFFWTDSSARKLISERYPTFLRIWDNYKEGIYRADALRYFVLHEFGGVYVDLDFQCLRPLDRVTYKYSAIFPVEHFEHAVFRLKWPVLLNNAIMMSRPKHPFLKYMIDRLIMSRNNKHFLAVAGPIFVHNQFFMYNGIKRVNKYVQMNMDENSTVPYVVRGKMKFPSDHADGIYVPNTHYFMNTLSASFDVDQVRKICRTSSITVDLKRACNELARRDIRSREDHFRFTYTVHHWFSSYFKPRISFENNSDIHEIVPNVRIY
ncbi:uncharacterized protein LOC128214464 [Mya arenaria]|uniref:uncharacterized protein LOC128214464 n=1 Tax=Mya arenaria TaxID=6604 RepID=UPI0022E0F78C|nr:uncharacterized protein LOC128214464 [Mya arenaria]